MQILVSRLERPWGLELQLAWLVRWCQDRDQRVTLYTRSYDRARFPGIAESVEQSSSPARELDPDRPTLVAGYPATAWVDPNRLDRYLILLENVPWGLYPDQQQKWIGKITPFDESWSRLLLDGLKQLVFSPVTAWQRRRRKSAHDRTLQQADSVVGFDNRMSRPLKEFHDVDLDVMPMWCPVGMGGGGEPRPCFVCIGPLELGQNLSTLLEAHYLFINRFGQQRQDVSLDEPQPLYGLWQRGTLTLKIFGEGEGEATLRNLAETYSIEDAVEFHPWPDPAELTEIIRDAVALVDVSRTSDASVLPYLAMANGVPSVYTHVHEALDSLVSGGPLAHPVPSGDPNRIGKGLMEASQVGLSERNPARELGQAMDPDSLLTELLERIDPAFDE